jgi:hypothetical protein
MFSNTSISNVGKWIQRKKENNFGALETKSRKNAPVSFTMSVCLSLRMQLQLESFSIKYRFRKMGLKWDNKGHFPRRPCVYFCVQLERNALNIYSAEKYSGQTL